MKKISVKKARLEDIKFSILNIKTFRPNIGLSASYYLDLINKKSRSNIKKGKPLSKNLLIKS